MAVKIRLRRMGAKKRPTYRFVATDSRMPRDGRFIEILGHYNPIESPATITVKEERVYYWLKQGAAPTDTVDAIFRQIGLWKKWEMMKKGEDVSELSLLTQLKERPTAETMTSGGSITSDRWILGTSSRVTAATAGPKTSQKSGNRLKLDHGWLRLRF